VFTPGNLGFPVAETQLGVLGVCVCYDLRFVEVARLLALQGAELICVPAAWTGGYDRRSGSDGHQVNQPPRPISAQRPRRSTVPSSSIPGRTDGKISTASNTEASGINVRMKRPARRPALQTIG
jgi:hypothetical protein